MSADWKPVLGQVQQLALANDYQCARHFVLDIVDAGAAQRLLAELAQRVRFGDAPERRAAGGSAVSVGFTFAALERLGVDEDCLARLREHAPGFAAGARARAARRLGDTGPSAPERWPAPFDADRASVLLSVHANAADVLERECIRLRQLDEHGTFAGWDRPLLANHLSPFDATRAPPRTAHFGLRDGIARPRIEALRPDPQQPSHRAGELLLGHENDAGFSLWCRDTWAEPTRAFFRNGTFAVFRQIHQDEPAFDAFIKRNAHAHGVGEDYLKAKLCGRWPAGQLIDEAHGNRAPPADAPVTNDFEFGARHDPLGLGCPFGSHIRRTNPRGDHLAPSRRRPLFRRGIPYGPEYAEGEAAGIERGLMGLFFCASIEDQFETVMSEWVEKMPMGPPSTGDAKDPLIGQHDEPRSAFHIPLAPLGRLELTGFKAFAQTRGTLYAFFPSRTGLAHIAKAAGAARPGAGAEAPLAPAAAPGKPAAGSAALPKGAPRRDPPAAATGGSDAPLIRDTAPADRFCDIVMEGGVTSGIIYASAIVELARHYRFHGIGGSSIGAFAAALAAAAELRRRSGSVAGFNDVAALPAALAEEDGDKRTKLFRLFRPQDETRRLFETFCAALGHTSWLARLRHGLAAALRQYRSPVLWAAVAVAVLVLGGPLAHVLLAPQAGAAWFWALLSWLLAAVLGVVLAGGAALAACVARDLLRMASARRDGNGFGLCRGWSRDATLRADEPDLTGYMHLAIQKAAGRHPVDDAPVTFADLWNAPGSPHALLDVPVVDGEPRSINLEVYATNLNHGRPYRFPLDEEGDSGPLYFRADELAPYFPARVLQHLLGHSLPYAPLDPLRDPPASEVRAGLRRLPREQLPIVVAARMAMSFPGLISAVPLWATSREPPDGAPFIGQCWLSDGGLCSNFPIHLFDSFVPQWPTFGISLQNASAPHDPWLPGHHGAGQADRHDPGTDDKHAPGKRLGAFLFAIWRAAWQWNDMAMLRMPGVRDRVVRVYLKPQQGGVNIRMTGADIRELEQLGTKAAEAFVKRFAAADSTGWAEHRWMRLHRLLVALRAAFTGLAVSAGPTRGAPSLAEQARGAALSSPLHDRQGIAQAPLGQQQVDEVQALLALLYGVEQGFADAGDSGPCDVTPRPVLRMRPPV